MDKIEFTGSPNFNQDPDFPDHEFEPVHQLQSQQDPSSSSQPSGGVILEQDRFLPIANISRIMKRVIPTEGKLSKEAKECVQECITEFLLFITSEASEHCAVEKRKTISGEDILTAFRTLGFDEYLTPLEDFLRKYREANKLQTTQATTLIQMGHANAVAAAANGEQNVEGSSTGEQAGQPLVYLQEQQLMDPRNMQPVQVFYDAANGQYFIPVQNAENGEQQWQQLNGNPVTAAAEEPPSKKKC